MSLLLKTTREDSRRFSTLAKAFTKAGREDDAYDYSVLSLRTYMSIDEYEKHQAIYHAYRENGTLPKLTPNTVTQ